MPHMCASAGRGCSAGSSCRLGHDIRAQGLGPAVWQALAVEEQTTRVVQLRKAASTGKVAVSPAQLQQEESLLGRMQVWAGACPAALFLGTLTQNSHCLVPTGLLAAHPSLPCHITSSVPLDRHSGFGSAGSIALDPGDACSVAELLAAKLAYAADN